MLPITQSLITNRINRPFLKLRSLKGIIIHWTANPRVGAGANAHARYFQNQNVSASAHYMVDDKNIIQIIPDDEVAYHVGSRSYREVGRSIMEGSFSPNHFLIGIEMCVNEDADWDSTYKNTVELTQHLMHKYNLKINQIWRHWDITGKDCPKMMCESEDEAWSRFLKIVESNRFPNEANVISTGIINASVNVRQGNGTYFKSLKVLPSQTKLNIYEKVGTWYRIGKGEWVATNVVSAISSRAVVGTGKVLPAQLNMRSGPSTYFPIVGKLNQNESVTILQKQGEWLQIEVNKWVHGNFIEIDRSKPKKYLAIANQLNVRSGPGTQNAAIGRLQKNDLVEVFEIQNGWARIGNNEWVSIDFLSEQMIKKGVVNTNTLNVRSGPGTSFPIVDKLNRSQTVEIFQEEANWFAIGADKWVHSDFVEILTV